MNAFFEFDIDIIFQREGFAGDVIINLICFSQDRWFIDQGILLDLYWMPGCNQGAKTCFVPLNADFIGLYQKGSLREYDISFIGCDAVFIISKNPK